MPSVLQLLLRPDGANPQRTLRFTIPPSLDSCEQVIAPSTNCSHICFSQPARVEID